MAISLSEEFKNQLAMQFGSSSGLADFVVPGAAPLVGSSSRWANARRRQARKASHDQSIKEESDSTSGLVSPSSVTSPTMTIQEELKATFASFGRRYVQFTVIGISHAQIGYVF